MQSAKCLCQFAAALALVGGLSLTSTHAQIGTGWTPITVPFVIQTSAGCTVTGSLATPVFNVPAGTSGRAERRYDTNTFSQRQFEGFVSVDSLGGDKVNVKQTFNQPVGPYNIIAIKKAGPGLGTFYEVEGGKTLFTDYVYGTKVKINTIIFSSGNVTVYFNNTFKETVKGATSGLNLYDKIGAYISASGSGPCQTTWSSVQFWRK